MSLSMMKRSISSNGTARRAPQRTCVGCRRVKDKRELLRVVRTAEGRVVLDAGGKMSGRGAYLCPSRPCWEAALKGNRLEHALKSSLTPEDRERLLKQGEEQLKGVD